MSVAALSDTMTITYDDGAATGLIQTRGVIGEGVAPATLTISESDPFDLGTIAENGTTDHTFVVTHAGAVPATSFVVNVGLTLPFQYKTSGTFPGSGGTCGSTVSIGSTCTIVVSYDPTTTGTDTDTISLNYFDGVTTQPLTRDIEAEAVTAGDILISEADPYNFGNVAIGGIAEHTFTLDNTGNVDVTSITGSGLVPPYRFKGGVYPGVGGTCGVTITPAAPPCDVVVTYEPSAGVTDLDTFDINFFDGAASQTLSLIHISEPTRPY